MKSLSEVHFRVVDKGIFLPIARRLAREAKQVTYWTPHEKAFPTLRDAIGDGFGDISRVESMWDGKDEVDCWVFPDVGFAAEQRELISQGKIVWGARDGDTLEVLRGKFLSVLMQTPLPVPPYQKIVGMSALHDHLRDKRDKWIKISRYRGDWETLHFRNWDQDELELDARAVKLGPWKDFLSFYVFDDIDTEIEDGCDSYCIDGAFPSTVIHGMEAKDKAFIGAFQKFADLPEELRRVNEVFGPILKEYGYRSFFSTEVRITPEGESYLIDPTCRAGSPPSQVQCEMIQNYGEIIWRGAHGELVEPIPAAMFGVQALLSAKGDPRSTWRVIELSDELDQWVKCGFCCKLENRLCFMPEYEATANEVGWLIGIGDTIEKAIAHLKSNMDLLPCGICCEFASLGDLLKEIHTAEDAGMEVTKQTVPEPEIVLK